MTKKLFVQAMNRGIITYENGKFYRHMRNGRKLELSETLDTPNRLTYHFSFDGYRVRINVLEALYIADRDIRDKTLVEDLFIYPDNGNWLDTSLENIRVGEQKRLW